MTQSLYSSGNFGNSSNHISMPSSFTFPHNFGNINPWRILKREILPFNAKKYPCYLRLLFQEPSLEEYSHPQEHLKNEPARTMRRELFPTNCM
ncbi:hypothetical protein NPIL_186921 [Nephila pilipes]|uniref:Uncharacterized protein n=1 Tax=Nephila pilipes TaxID=299642 RepID=A0A8X6PJ33_NEPPI|nr:hypothetical protein NPIL_186921 [Nephila pilipes]